MEDSSFNNRILEILKYFKMYTWKHMLQYFNIYDRFNFSISFEKKLVLKNEHHYSIA